MTMGAAALRAILVPAGAGPAGTVAAPADGPDRSRGFHRAAAFRRAARELEAGFAS